MNSVIVSSGYVIPPTNIIDQTREGLAANFVNQAEPKLIAAYSRTIPTIQKKSYKKTLDAS